MNSASRLAKIFESGLFCYIFYYHFGDVLLSKLNSLYKYHNFLTLMSFQTFEKQLKILLMVSVPLLKEHVAKT